MTTEDFNAIPVGLYVIRMYHERLKRCCLHLALKVDDKPWFDQPTVPVFSAEVMPEKFGPFWQWAENNLPVLDRSAVPVESSTFR